MSEQTYRKIERLQVYKKSLNTLTIKLCIGDSSRRHSSVNSEFGVAKEKKKTMRTRRKNCSESCQLRKPPNGIWYPANCIIQITETRYDDDDYRPAPEQQQQNSTVVDGGGGGFKNVLSKFCLSCSCSGFRCLTVLCRCSVPYCVFLSQLWAGLDWTGRSIK